MNNSLKIVKELINKNSPDLITESAMWSVLNFEDQLEEDEIEIKDEYGVIKGVFDFKETSTTIFMKAQYDPKAEYQTFLVEGQSLESLGTPELGKKRLTLEILKKLLTGNWITEKSKQLGCDVMAEFSVGDFICLIDTYNDEQVMEIFLPVTFDMRLVNEEDFNE